MVRHRSSSVKEDPVMAQPDDDVNVLFAVWLLARRTGATLDAALGPSGLTSDDYAVYSVLTGSESVTPTELARWMAAPLTTVSSAVKRLERRGHVRRLPHPDDGRSYRIGLTAAGRRAHRQATVLFESALAAVVEDLGPAEPRVREALRKLATSLDAVAPPPG
jgi:DNA-binding MarR family transcriptional regulator